VEGAFAPPSPNNTAPPRVEKPADFPLHEPSTNSFWPRMCPMMGVPPASLARPFCCGPQCAGAPILGPARRSSFRHQRVPPMAGGTGGTQHTVPKKWAMAHHWLPFGVYKNTPSRGRRRSPIAPSILNQSMARSQLGPTSPPFSRPPRFPPPGWPQPRPIETDYGVPVCQRSPLASRFEERLAKKRVGVAENPLEEGPA